MLVNGNHHPISMATSQIIIGCNDDLNMIYKWDINDDLAMMVTISLINPTISIYLSIYIYIYIYIYSETIYCNVVNPIINYPITAKMASFNHPQMAEVGRVNPGLFRMGGWGVTLKI